MAILRIARLVFDMIFVSLARAWFGLDSGLTIAKRSEHLMKHVDKNETTNENNIDDVAYKFLHSQRVYHAASHEFLKILANSIG